MATTSTSQDGAAWSVVESVASNIDEPATSKRKEIEQRKEVKKKQDEADCTFQPTLAARRGRDIAVKPVVGSRFDHLYDDAIKRKTEGQGAPDDSENTFRPSISPRARSISSDRKASDMINNLHNATGAGRTVVKEDSKDANTFKPTITRRGSSAGRNSDSDASARLYEFRNRQEENLQKKKEEAEAKFSSECTFAPKLSRSRSTSREPGSPKPVIDRLLQYGEEKKTKLESDIKLKAEKDALGATFQPVIPRRNSKIGVSNEMDSADVYSRLTQPVEKVQAEIDINLTFQPKLTTSHHSVRDNNNCLEGETIYDRLHREGLEKKLGIDEEQRLALVEEDKKCTFAPLIPVRAASIILDGNGEPPAPVFERLNTSRQFMQNILSQIKSDLELNECTFQPQLTTTGIKAERRASEGPVHARLDRDAFLIKLEKQKREEERLSAEVEGSTFHPQLPESSQGIIRRKSFLSESHNEEGLGSAMLHDIHTRLNSTHTVASLGGVGFDENNAVEVGHSIDKASADAVVERLMAAAGKHKENLIAWKEKRENNEVEGATFSPQIGVKKTHKLKEGEVDCDGSGTWSATPSLDTTLSPTNAAKKSTISPVSASNAKSKSSSTSTSTTPRGAAINPRKESLGTKKAVGSPSASATNTAAPTLQKVPGPKVTAAKALPPPPTKSPVKTPAKSLLKTNPTALVTKPVGKAVSPVPPVKSTAKQNVTTPLAAGVKPPLSPRPASAMSKSTSPILITPTPSVKATVAPRPSSATGRSASVSGRASPITPSTSSSTSNSPRKPSGAPVAPTSSRSRASLTPSSIFNPSPKQISTPTSASNKVPLKITTKKISL